MRYKVGLSTYSFSYSELKKDYERYIGMTDEEFIQEQTLIKILHFACFVCYFKELPTNAVLIDNGIIHELIHLMDDVTKEGALDRLGEIREKFNSVCKLA